MYLVSAFLPLYFSLLRISLSVYSQFLLSCTSVRPQTASSAFSASSAEAECIRECILHCSTAQWMNLHCRRQRFIVDSLVKV